MAAPKDSPEQAYRLRKFQGTGTEIDSTFLGPSYVQRSQNWIPTQSYRLGKRPGTTLLGHVALGTTEVTHLLPAHAPDGTLYLFAFCQKSSGGQVNQSISEGAFAAVPMPAGVFPTTARGRSILFRDRVYAGNGIDPLVSWQITDTNPADVLVFNPMGTLDDSTAFVQAVDNPATFSGDPLPTGTYSFCWGVFNTSTKLYVSRSPAKTIDVNAGTNHTGVTLHVRAPTTALATNTVYRFFVTPRNYPIEYATAQGPDLLATATAGTDGPAGSFQDFSTVDVTDLMCPIVQGITRTGNMFLVWRNRVVFAGSANDPYSIYATDIILPGLEQTAFNQGTLFPVGAKIPLPQKVTGIGIAGVTSDQDATSPLLFFTESRTYLAINGDPFDPNDENVVLVEISTRVGCVSHDSIVNTPLGVLFVGIDSVYLIPPGGGYPQDVGWPIADQIRGIPTNARSEIVACFHKQFYKIACPAPGGATNTQQWWLDLRQGLGGTPSWWGPHQIGQNPVDAMPAQALSAMCADASSSLEVDRGYAALDNSDAVIVTHQLGLFSDWDPSGANPRGIGVNSVLVSGRFDWDQPFIAKVMTRLRLIGQTASKTMMGVVVIVDNGASTKLDDIILGEDMELGAQFVHLNPFPDPPNPPPNQCFNTAMFTSISAAEVQTIAPYKRPRFLSIQAVLTHGPRPEDDQDPNRQAVPAVELRDFELLFIPSERKVRYVSTPRFGPERVSV